MISLAAGWLACQRLAPAAPLPSRAALALALGLGLLSLTSYLWLAAGKPGTPALLGLEGAVLVSAWALPRPRRVGAASSASGPGSPLLAAVTTSAALGALLAAFHMGQRFPFGAWDAVDIWNYRALVFHRSGLEAALEGVTHSDYPLLLPLVSSYAWHFVGEVGTLPFVVGTSCAAGAAALLYGETRWRRGPAAAMVATSLLLATPFYAVHAGSQRADVPLSFFALAATVALARHERRSEAGLLLLTGALTGCAAWTKNEGLAYAASLLVAWLVTGPRARLRGLGWIAAGALPFALALVHHKLSCGATTDLIAAQGSVTLSRLVDPGRWAAVVHAFARESGLYVAAGLWLVLALGWLRCPPAARTEVGDLRFVWLAVGSMLAIDFGVYLTTPFDPAWHLDSSLDRVLLQLWPTALWALATGAPPPWRRASSEGGGEQGCGDSPRL